MIRALNEIGRHVNLENPNEVSLYIAKKKAMDSFRANLCDFYKHYADYFGIHAHACMSSGSLGSDGTILPISLENCASILQYST